MVEGCGYRSWKEGTGSQIITFLGGSGGENFPKGSRERQRSQALSVNEQESEKKVSQVGVGQEVEEKGKCDYMLNRYIPVKWLGILLYGFGGKAGGCFSTNGLVRGMSMPSLGSGMPFAGGVSGAGFGVWPARHTPVSPDN